MEAVIAVDRDGMAIDTEAAPTAAASEATPAKMFRYSEFLDIGEGAVECEHSRDGKCEDREHFHAWCRLPNRFQHTDIRSKGLAAKARAIRALKDPESDASVTLESELAQLDDPAFADAIIDELLAREWAEDYLEAQRETDEHEEFEHIEQDREEFARLHAEEGELPEDQQSGEYKRLSAHVQAHMDAVREELENRQRPRREDLRGRESGSLLGLLRGKRIEEDGNRAFLETYNAWMWFVGTFQVEPHDTLRRPHKPMWESIGRPDTPSPGTMFGEAPEVIDALKVLYSDLSLSLQRGSAGN